jgi:hypothetical protein
MDSPQTPDPVTANELTEMRLVVEARADIQSGRIVSFRAVRKWVNEGGSAPKSRPPKPR